MELLEPILIIFNGIIGALIPYWLQRKANLDAVKASAFPGLIVGLIAYAINHPLGEELALVFYGVTFVGMVSRQILPTYRYVAFAGFFFSLLYLNASSFFNGYGGGLGTAACVAVLGLFGFRKLKVLWRYLSWKPKKD